MAIFTELDEDVRRMAAEVFEIVFERSPRTDKDSLDPDFVSRILRDSEVEVTVVEAQPLPRTVLAAAERLKLIASVRTTPSNVDLDAARERGIQVTRSPARNAIAVAEFTIAQILNCARMIPFAYTALKRGEYVLPPGGTPNTNSKDVIWSHPGLPVKPYVVFKGREIAGSTLGIVGFGSIGRLVAERAAALGMRVLFFDPYLPETETEKAERVKTLEELLSRSDFVSLHAKTTAETEGMIDTVALARMKPTAYLVNTARGALIRQSDLVLALRSRTIAGAALDVFETEPLVRGDEIFELDNLIYTPHIGGATKDVIRHHSESVWRNLRAFLAGEIPPDRVG
mgnify:FL=1